MNKAFTSPNNMHGQLEAIRYLIVHASAQSLENLDARELVYLESDRSDYVYHAYVSDSGEVTQLAPWDSLLWHAGESQWGRDTDLNRYAIGVAFGASETGPYTAEQLGAMRALVEMLMRQFDIPAERVLGHKEVSPNRKTDPKYLDMDAFRRSLRADAIPSYRVMDPKTNRQIGTLQGRLVRDKLYTVSLELAGRKVV